MTEPNGKLAFNGMAANGNGHTNGNAARVAAHYNILKEGIGLGIAEFISMGVSLGVVAVADDLAPNLVKDTSKFVAKTCIAPFQDAIEWGLGTFCQLKECKVDYTKPRNERAEDY